MNVETAADIRDEAGGSSPRVQYPTRSAGLPTIPADVLLRTLACVVMAVSIVHWLMQSATMIISREGTPDFSDYFTAALILRDNLHANLYDPQLLRATANLHHTFLVRNFAFYLYPPLLALLMIPLTFFSFMTAARIWMVLNFALWILTAALIADLLRHALLNGETPSTRREGLISESIQQRGLFARAVSVARSLSDTTVISIAVAAFLCLTSYTIELAVSLGQVSLLILFLILLAPWLIRRGHPVLGGIVLAIAALIKVFPIVLIGYYVLRGRWRVVAGAVSALIVLILGMTVLIGFAGMLAAPAAILADGRASGVQFQNQSLARMPLWVAAIFGRYPGGLTGKLGYGLVAVAGLAFCAGVLLVRRRETRYSGVQTGADTHATMTRDLLGYSWALATMLLLAPNSWPHDFTWLLPVVVFCIGYAVRRLATGVRAAGGRVKVEVPIVACLAFGYALTMFQLPFQYDGSELFSLGPRFFIFWVRPFFMLERPLGAILIWCCAGVLFLRSSRDTQDVAAMSDESWTTIAAPSPLPISAEGA